MTNDSIDSSLQGTKRNVRYYKTFMLMEVYKVLILRKRVIQIKNGSRKMTAKFKSSLIRKIT